MKNIQTVAGLKTLLERYERANASEEWIKTIKGCIEGGYAMDEIDYQNTPKELRKLWTGLK